MSALENAIKKIDWKYMLNNIGEEYVKWLKYLIKTNRKIASGRLLKSIDYKVIKQTTGYILKITSEDYLKYVDGGRRAGAKMPPINPIKKWVEMRGIKFEKMSSKQTAFIIARSISKKGIEPTNIISQAQGKALLSLRELKISEKDKIDILRQIAYDLANFSGSTITIKK